MDILVLNVCQKFGFWEVMKVNIVMLRSEDGIKVNQVLPPRDQSWKWHRKSEESVAVPSLPTGDKNMFLFPCLQETLKSESNKKYDCNFGYVRFMDEP